MKKIMGIMLITVYVLCSPILTIAQTGPAAPSQSDLSEMSETMIIDPRECAALQSRIDKLTSVADSSLSEVDKVARISEFLNQSLDSMKQSASSDPDVSQIMNQYLSLMQGIISAARNSADPDKINPSIVQDVSKLKIMTQTYVQLMKIMCPDLRLPQSFAK
jgi:DNA repair ATPase RecN